MATEQETKTELEIAVLGCVDSLGANNRNNRNTKPPTVSTQISASYSNSSIKSINSSVSRSNTAHSTPPAISPGSESTLLPQLTTNELSLITEYILENDETFIKFKDLSSSIKSACIQYEITGDFFIKYKRPEFSKKLPSVKKGISAKIYKKIKSMTDDDIQQTLEKCKENEKLKSMTDDDIQQTPKKCIIFGADSGHSCSGDSKTNNNDDNDDNDNNDNKNDDIKTPQTPQTPSTPIPNDCNKSNNYIKIPQYLPQINILKKQKEEIYDIENYNKNEFLVFVYILFIMNEYKETEIEKIMKGLNKLELSGKGFINIKRVNFCRGLKEQSNVQGAKAAKSYKLIKKSIEEKDVFNDDTLKLKVNLSYFEISNVAITDFQISARKMLTSMNEAMKSNHVNGSNLVQYYIKKKDLETYLEENVRRKSVNVLTDLLWSDYMNDKENKLFIINEYDRKQLLKYFISLYMNYIKIVIIKHKLDSNKCLSLKRKGVCKILTAQCGITIGIATNIVDKIYSNITK